MTNSAHEAYAIATQLTLTGDAQAQLKLYIKTVMDAEAVTQSLTNYVRELNSALRKESGILSRLTPKLGAFLGVTRGTSNAFSALTPHVEQFNESLGRTERRITSTAEKMGALHAKSISLGFMGFTPKNMAVAGGAYLGYKGFKAGEESQLYDARLKILKEPELLAKQQQFVSQYKSQFPLLDNNQLKEAFQNSVYFISKKQNLVAGAMDIAKVMELQLSMPNSKMTAGARDQEQYIRAVEMFSGGDSKKFSEYADIVARMMGEGIDPRNVANLAVRLRNNRYGLSPESLYDIAALVKEQGGHITGTMFTNLFRTTSGTTTKKAGKQFINLDLLDPTKVTFNKAGGIDYIEPTAWKDYKLKNEAPIQWIIKDLLPAIEKRYPNDRGAQQQLISLLFPGTGSSLVGLIQAQAPQILTTSKRLSGAMSLDEQVALGKELPTAKIAELNAALHDLFISIGGVMTSSPVIAGIKLLTYLIRNLAESLEVIGNATGRGISYATSHTGLFHNLPGASVFSTMPQAQNESSAHGNVYLDVDKVGISLSNYYARTMGRAMASSTQFNASMQLPQVQINR